MSRKLTVKEILGSRGKINSRKFTHIMPRAEACETAGVDMIITSEMNDYNRIRSAAPTHSLRLDYDMVPT